MSQSFMIEIDEKIVGVWFMSTTSTQDWLCSIRELEPDTKYKITYRFRDHKDDKPFDSDDKKRWHVLTSTCTRAYAIAAVRDIAKNLHNCALEMTNDYDIGGVYELLNEGDHIEFYKKFMNAPFIYVRMETL